MYIFINNNRNEPKLSIEDYFICYGDASPFLLESHYFRLTEDINQAEGVAILFPLGQRAESLLNYILKFPKIKNIFILDIFHIAEGIGFDDENIKKYTKIYRDNSLNLFYIHTRIGSNIGIRYDFLWNRQKRAFTDYSNSNLQNTTWFHGAKEEMFVLPPISKKGKLRKFLAPNRIYHNPEMLTDRIFKRAALYYFLQQEDGYIGNIEKNEILHIEGCTTEETHWYGFAPIANEYYTSSFVSIYVETLTYLNKHPHIRSITEKTWNPLIKGHFILPYGYRGMIRDITNYGVLLPDWIDYSYDNADDTHRFDGFMRSVYKILELSTEQLLEYFHRDRWILEHNRNLFFEKPFDSLYDKTIKKIGNTGKYLL